MSGRTFRCYAFGSEKNWEAICVDLDISVQGESFREVLDLMGEAISTYVVDALNEAPAQAEKLMERRAPWYVRAKLAFEAATHILRSRRDSDQMTANFDVPCHA